MVLKNALIKRRSAILVALIMIIGTQFLAVIQVQATPVVSVGKSVQATPFESNPTAAVDSGIGVVAGALSNSYDGDWDTQCNFKYGFGDGYLELSAFNNSAPTPFEIWMVDFKISYKATGTTGFSDEAYRIIYYVGDSPTVDNTVVLQDWVFGDAAKFNHYAAQSNRPWSGMYEPNDYTWDWTDISNIKVRVETDQVTTSHLQTFTLYEVWLSIYPAPLPPTGLSVQPSFVNVSVGDAFFVDVYIVDTLFLFGYQFELRYNTTILTATEFHTYSPFVEQYPSGIEDDPWGNATGRVYVAFSTFLGDDVGFTGNTPTNRIYFQVDAKGVSNLHLTEVFLADVNGNSLIVDKTDGKFDNRHPPVVDFNWTPTEPLEGEMVTFNASDSYDPDGTIVSYSWDFGDGQTGTGVITTHVYTTALDYPGTYPVVLAATDNQGAVGSKTKYITVTKHDVAVTYISVQGADFTNPLLILPGQNVSIDVETVNLGFYTETFNITFRYNNTGIDTARLDQSPTIILDPDQFDFRTFNWTTTGISAGLYIINATAGPVPGEIHTADNSLTGDGYSSSVLVLGPKASFTWTPTAPVASETVTFDASSSYDIGGNLVSYAWDFGDDQTGNGVTTTHVYTEAKTYTVNLTVTDNNAKTDTILKLVNVTPRPPPAITLDPSSGPVGTKVKVEGTYFMSGTQVDLMFDDQIIGYTSTDGNGAFEAVINVPVSEAGVHTMKAVTQTSPTAEAEFTVIDNTPLDLEVDVGSIHFRSEKAEFYMQTAFKGTPINVTSIKATLYKPDGTSETLTGIQHVATGLYKAPYNIPTNAPTGTYALAAEADYLTGTVDSKGTSMKSFLVSPTLTGWNALLISINGTVATIKTDIGLVKLNLNDINATLSQLIKTAEGEILAKIDTALGTITTDLDTINGKLVAINGTIVTINSSVGLIQTDMNTINAKITSINGTLVTIKTDLGTLSGKITTLQGDTATIKTDVGTIKTTIRGWTGATVSSIVTPSGTFNLLALTTSTLQSMTFADNTLTVIVDGPTGTTGTLNFVIPKQFLTGIQSTIQKIATTINDKQTAFTYTENTETYVLSLSYTHSTETIKIFLTGMPSQPQLPLTTILMIIAAIVLAAAMITIYMKKLRKKPIKP